MSPDRRCDSPLVVAPCSLVISVVSSSLILHPSSLPSPFSPMETLLERDVPGKDLLDELAFEVGQLGLEFGVGKGEDLDGQQSGVARPAHAGPHGGHGHVA